MSTVPPLTLGGVLAIAVLALFAQLPSFDGAGIWDDQIMIFENPRIHASDGLYRFWFTTEQSDYWPLSYSTHWIEWRLWRDWAPGYRAVNFVLHVANSVLVWRVLARLRVPAAWLCGAVFAAHPLALEAVAWTFQRKTVLSTMLAFASLASFLRFEAAQRRGWYVAAVLLFLLAILAKSAVVMWPFVVLLVAWWQRRRIALSDLVRSAPFFAISLAFGLIGMWFQTNVSIATHAEIVRTDPLWSRAAIAGWAVWFYVYKAILPVNLAFVYPRWELSQASVVEFLPSVVVLVVLAVCFAARRSWGAAPLAAWSYYLLNLVPVLGFITIYFMRFSYVADHWQYLALPGLIALVVGSLGYAAARVPALVVLARAGAVGMLGLLVWASFDAAQIYGKPDNVLLWQDTIEKNPDCWLAHNNAAHLLAERGEYDLAAKHLRAAFRLDPSQGPLYAEGVAQASRDFIRRQMHDSALLYLRLAVDFEPTVPKRYLDLAEELHRVRRTPEAIVVLQQGIERAGDEQSTADLASRLELYRSGGDADSP